MAGARSPKKAAARKSARLPRSPRKPCAPCAPRAAPISPTRARRIFPAPPNPEDCRRSDRVRKKELEKTRRYLERQVTHVQPNTSNRGTRRRSDSVSSIGSDLSDLTTISENDRLVEKWRKIEGLEGTIDAGGLASQPKVSTSPSDAENIVSTLSTLTSEADVGSSLNALREMTTQAQSQEVQGPFPQTPSQDSNFDPGSVLHTPKAPQRYIWEVEEEEESQSQRITFTPEPFSQEEVAPGYPVSFRGPTPLSEEATAQQAIIERAIREQKEQAEEIRQEVVKAEEALSESYLYTASSSTTATDVTGKPRSAIHGSDGTEVHDRIQPPSQELGAHAFPQSPKRERTPTPDERRFPQTRYDTPGAGPGLSAEERQRLLGSIPQETVISVVIRQDGSFELRGDRANPRWQRLLEVLTQAEREGLWGRSRPVAPRVEPAPPVTTMNHFGYDQNYVPQLDMAYGAYPLEADLLAPSLDNFNMAATNNFSTMAGPSSFGTTMAGPNSFNASMAGFNNFSNTMAGPSLFNDTRAGRNYFNAAMAGPSNLNAIGAGPSSFDTNFAGLGGFNPGLDFLYNEVQNTYVPPHLSNNVPYGWTNPHISTGAYQNPIGQGVPNYLQAYQNPVQVPAAGMVQQAQRSSVPAVSYSTESDDQNMNME
ncbi:unnamed protein product [Somion occarium]|uniref:Uncharacterized protein n=1 Tax=Somion occarium TaxID=3059160 RepID=A0ABP1DN38_9APHY